MHQFKHRAAVLAAVILAGTGILTGCSFGHSAPEVTPRHLGSIEDTTFPKGVFICGVDMQGKTRAEARSILSRKEVHIDPISIKLTMDEDVYTYTEADFTIDFDYEASIQEAYDFLFTDTEPHTYYAKKYLLSKEDHFFGVEPSLNFKSVKEKLTELAESLNKEAVEPEFVSIKGKKLTFSDGENGIEIDTKALIKEVKAQLKTGNTVEAEIPYEEVEPKYKKEDFDGTVAKLGTFSTISTNNENGNKNMALALDYCNNTVLLPGEVFSFNGTTGDSTNSSRGFVKAGVISNGRSSEDYGGGICQASTTIYGAVCRSDLEIVERGNHAWPSSYVPIGQDAAIDYYGQDFKFKNNTDGPILLQCSMSGTTLSAAIYGQASKEWDTIEISSEQTGTMSQPEDEYVEDSELKKGEIEVYRQGREGKTASATKTFYKDGKVVKTEAMLDSYYPALSTIYHYGPGTKINS